jgi:predicted nucleic acid-binding protein
MMVIDASVAAKWFLPEPGQDEVEKLLSGEYQLIAPELIRVEVAAAIVKRVRLKLMDEGEATAACDRWKRVLQADVIELVPDADLLASAIELAISAKHALQDCLYLAAAVSAGAGLFTADRVLAERGRPMVSDIRLLGLGHAA